MRFHVNPETGNVNKCAAKKLCPFGDMVKDHYDTREAAAQAFEQKMEREQLSQKLARLEAQRQALSEKLESAWQKKRGRIGYSYELAVPREEYQAWREESWQLGRQADQVKRLLRPPLTPYVADDYVIGLDTAQDELIHRVNLSPVDYEREEDQFYFGKDIDSLWRETMARYERGERIEGSAHKATPDDRLLAVLCSEDNGLMSHSAMYAALVFPEKNLRPVLERLGVENVSAAPFYNSREWGLAYTVLTPSGDTRSFNIYEHRNTDSLIISGETNWNRAQRPYGPYGDRGKNDFFAEFASSDHRQLAETLGYFLKQAQEGELESDEELASKAEHRDWNAILRQQLPAFGEWLDTQGVKEEKRWFEE